MRLVRLGGLEKGSCRRLDRGRRERRRCSRHSGRDGVLRRASVRVSAMASSRSDRRPEAPRTLRLVAPAGAASRGRSGRADRSSLGVPVASGAPAASCPFRMRVQSNSTSGLCSSMRRMASSSSAARPDPHPRGRAEPVEDPRTGPPATAGRLHHDRVFVAAFVAAETQVTAGLLPFLRLHGGLPGRRADALALPRCGAAVLPAAFGRAGAATLGAPSSAARGGRPLGR